MRPGRSSRKLNVPNIWVVQASPVITLAKAGHLALPTELADKVLLPDAVVSELLAAALKQSVEEQGRP
jgi:hypothetical protein